jgi:hypothetical protein
VDEDMRAEAPGALPVREQLVPSAPQLGLMSVPALPAARRSCSSCSLLPKVTVAPTAADATSFVVGIDESAVSFPSTGGSRRSLLRKPRPLGTQINSVVQFYNTSRTGIDHADALRSLHRGWHWSTSTDVLR